MYLKNCLIGKKFSRIECLNPNAVLISLSCWKTNSCLSLHCMYVCLVICLYVSACILVDLYSLLSVGLIPNNGLKDKEQLDF